VLSLLSSLAEVSAMTAFPTYTHVPYALLQPTLAAATFTDIQTAAAQAGAGQAFGVSLRRCRRCQLRCSLPRRCVRYAAAVQYGLRGGGVLLLRKQSRRFPSASCAGRRVISGCGFSVYLVGIRRRCPLHARAALPRAALLPHIAILRSALRVAYCCLCRWYGLYIQRAATYFPACLCSPKLYSACLCFMGEGWKGRRRLERLATILVPFSNLGSTGRSSARHTCSPSGDEKLYAACSIACHRMPRGVQRTN